MENYAIEILFSGLTIAAIGLDMAAHTCFSPFNLVGPG